MVLRPVLTSPYLPACNVTIHNRCKDTLPNCTKVKQKQQKAALLKNNSALQSVSLRNKTATRERPNSAIYPSESFRQTLLGSRRGRPTLSLSKSVSTTNIAGNFKHESPLGLRRILSQSTDSLNMRNRTLSVESLIDEGAEFVYSQLMSDFETDEKDFEADSWSLAVDNNYLQQHKKEVMKRQDVIYELIQTELHHVRTLKIMTNMFRKGMLEDLQMDPALVQSMFPCVDELSDVHDRFLTQLLVGSKESLANGRNKNIRVSLPARVSGPQFSGHSAEQMKKAYAEFCSRHTKAVKLYKELFARDKRFQQFIRRLTRSSVLRRHGVQECILLVTQRITKYPVLIDRILQNSKGNEVDQRDLGMALTLVKDLISAIDLEVHEQEKSARLQEIYGRVDGRVKAQLLWEGFSGFFSKDELLRRKLVHDGCLLWKTATGRFKDILVLLMTDVLIFLQEKDQKFTFPALDKPAVISLQNLIVRDIANQEKGMFLLSGTPPEMYEVHAASRDDRNTWMKVIQQTVRLCPSRQDFPLIETETEASLRKLKDQMAQRDREITELLEEKVGLFTEMLSLQSGCEDPPACPAPRTLFRAESLEGPRGEKLLNEAIREVECLKDLFMGAGRDWDQNHPADPDGTGSNNTTNGETSSLNGASELCLADSDSGQRDGNGNQLQQKVPREELIDRLATLYGLLHGLQVCAIESPSSPIFPLAGGVPTYAPHQQGGRWEKVSRANSRKGVLGQLAPKAQEKQATELALLQKQHVLLQEELSRCRQLCQEKVQEVGSLEARLRESEQERARLEREVEETRRQVVALRSEGGVTEGMWIRKGADPRRRSLPAGDALYFSFTPPQVGYPRCTAWGAVLCAQCSRPGTRGGGSTNSRVAPALKWEGGREPFLRFPSSGDSAFAPCSYPYPALAAQRGLKMRVLASSGAHGQSVPCPRQQVQDQGAKNSGCSLIWGWKTPQPTFPLNFSIHVQNNFVMCTKAHACEAHRGTSHGPREEPGYCDGPERLQECDEDSEALSEDEDVACHHSPPSSPREFSRMQDIPEEVESSQELKDGEGGSLDS
nr:rho guanine nucleotide exchange factor 2 [Pelodiscus sinensis]|eukprot:XP_014424472.1 rho guanine nucleotide exchange factor 2 [Pelodiscus sinensis]